MLANTCRHHAGKHSGRNAFNALLHPLNLHACNTPLHAGIVLGKHSGRNALNTRLKALGYNTGISELDDVFK